MAPANHHIRVIDPSALLTFGSVQTASHWAFMVTRPKTEPKGNENEGWCYFTTSQKQKSGEKHENEIESVRSNPKVSLLLVFRQRLGSWDTMCFIILSMQSSRGKFIPSIPKPVSCWDSRRIRTSAKLLPHPIWRYL